MSRTCRIGTISFLCALTLAMHGQMPDDDRRAELLREFPLLQNTPRPEWPFIRDRSLRLEASSTKLENDYTSALQALAAREAEQANAQAAVNAARERERASRKEFERARADPVGELQAEAQRKLSPGSPERDLAFNEAVTEASQLAQYTRSEWLGDQLALGEATRRLHRVQDKFDDAVKAEREAWNARNEGIPPALREYGPAYGTLVQKRVLLVRFRDDASPDEIRGIFRDHGLTLVGGMVEISLFVLELQQGSESDVEHLVRLNRIAEALRLRRVVFSAVQQLTLASILKPPEAGPLPPGPAPGGSCCAWYDEVRDGQPSATLIKLTEAWDFLSLYRPQGGPSIAVTVLDDEFDDHDHLLNRSALCVGAKGPHGNQVSGLIVGTSGNGIIGGGTAVVTIATCAVAQVPGYAIAEREAAFTSVLFSLRELLIKQHQRIINISLGYNWFRIANANRSDIERVVENQGAITRDLLAVYRNESVIVTSAGNDGDDAMWNSPMNWAALGPDPSPLAVTGKSENVLAVEAVKSDGGPLFFSNKNGSVAAPGYYLLTCLSGVGQGSDLGTSLSAPIVSGVAALMLAQNPKLTPARVVEILKEAAPAPQRIVNARAAIERAQLEVSRMAADYTGNGVVDWDDYVEFRRDLLAVENGQTPATLRADLNRDGVVSRSATNPVTGFTSPMTDLQVMQAVWKDETVEAADLDGLLN